MDPHSPFVPATPSAPAPSELHTLQLRPPNSTCSHAPSYFSNSHTLPFLLFPLTQKLPESQLFLIHKLTHLAWRATVPGGTKGNQPDMPLGALKGTLFFSRNWGHEAGPGWTLRLGTWSEFLLPTLGPSGQYLPRLCS